MDQLPNVSIDLTKEVGAALEGMRKFPQYNELKSLYDRHIDLRDRYNARLQDDISMVDRERMEDGLHTCRKGIFMLMATIQDICILRAHESN